MKESTNYIAGIVVIIAIVLIVPHLGNDIWRNGHAVELAILAALIGLLIIVSVGVRGDE